MNNFANSAVIVLYLLGGTLGIAAVMSWLLKRMK